MQTFYGDLDYGGIEELASISQHVINQAKYRFFFISTIQQACRWSSSVSKMDIARYV